MYFVCFAISFSLSLNHFKLSWKPKAFLLLFAFDQISFIFFLFFLVVVVVPFFSNLWIHLAVARIHQKNYMRSTHLIRNTFKFNHIHSVLRHAIPRNKLKNKYGTQRWGATAMTARENEREKERSAQFLRAFAIQKVACDDKKSHKCK